MTDRTFQVALSRYGHDRIANRRVDDAWLAEVWADPATRVLEIAGTRFRIVDGRVPWTSPAEAPEGTKVLLGDRGGVVYFAVITDPARSGDDWVGMRGAVAGVDLADAELLVHAVGIAEWLWATRHCPRCGGPLDVHNLGHLLICRVCGREEFPRTDPAVIMIVTDGDGPDARCLLGRNPHWPPGRYSTLAGFVEPGESLEKAVRREVLEETGVRIGEVAYLGSQPWPLPRSLMVGFVAYAETTEIVPDGAEIEDARWFTRAELHDRVADGTLGLPGGISISRTLIEYWYGGPLPDHDASR